MIQRYHFVTRKQMIIFNHKRLIQVQEKRSINHNMDGTGKKKGINGFINKVM